MAAVKTEIKDSENFYSEFERLNEKVCLFLDRQEKELRGAKKK